MSIWLAVDHGAPLASELGRRLASRQPVRIASADWVVPVEGPPIRDGAVAIDDGGSPPSDRGTSWARASSYPRGGHPPRLRQRPQPPRVRRCTAGSATGSRFAAVDRAARRAQGADRPRGDGGDRPPRSARVPPLGDHDGRRLQLQRRRRDGVRGARPAGDRLPRGLRRRRASRSRGRFEPMRERDRRRSVRRRPARASRRTPPTPARSSSTRTCAELGLPVATHLAESADGDAVPTTAAAPWETFAEMLVPPPGTTGIRALAEAGPPRTRTSLAAHCVKVDDEEIALLAEHDVAVAHCPRSNAHPRLRGRAARASCARPASASCIATDSPASTPSFDMFDEMRAAMLCRAGARGDARRADRRRTRSSSRRSAARGRSGSTTQIGSLVPGKRADLTVLSLADTPFIPWEDPVTATVLGGSPEGVVATLVSGETAVREGREDMARADDAARSARGRLLSARRSDVVIEDTMFFPRLRRHAKWMFLAARARLRARLRRLRRRRRRDRLRRRSATARRWSGAPSVSKAAAEGPREPEGRAGVPRPRDRATRPRATTDDAIDGAPELLRSSRPKDTDALRELAASTSRRRPPHSSARRSSSTATAYLAPGGIRDTSFAARREPAHARPDHERREHGIRDRDLRGRIAKRKEPRRRRSSSTSRIAQLQPEGPERPARARARPRSLRTTSTTRSPRSRRS